MRAVAVAVVVVWLGACETPTATVNFHTGSLPFTLRSSEITLPEELRDGDRVRELPCGPMGRCPTADAVAISCEGELCDPAPTTLSVPVGDVLDFDALGSELEDLFREVDTVEITEVEYRVELNTLTVDIGQAELFWGPEGAATVASPGVVRLGVVPSLPARSTGGGFVALDAAGNGALSDFLVHTARRVRFFVRTQVDLEPGGPFPAGDLTVAVDMSVRATGRVAE